jgi:hypothetical protein
VKNKTPYIRPDFMAMMMIWLRMFRFGKKQHAAPPTHGTVAVAVRLAHKTPGYDQHRHDDRNAARAAEKRRYARLAQKGGRA